MSILSDLAWRVGGFKGSLRMCQGTLKSPPACASTETYKLIGELSNLTHALSKSIENDYQEAKKKIQASQKN